MLPPTHVIKSNLTHAPRLVQHTRLYHVADAGREENEKVIKALNLPGDFLSPATSVAYCLIHQVDLSEQRLEDSRSPASSLLSALPEWNAFNYRQPRYC